MARGPEFEKSRLEKLDAAIEEAIKNHDIPGAVVWLERDGTHYEKAYGARQTVPSVEPMTLSTIFDLASLTKVVATTPCVLRLLQDEKLRLDEPVTTYLPEFKKAGHEKVLLRNLLTHTSGLPPGISRDSGWQGYDAGLAEAYALDLRQAPGTKFVYSDVNFILLGEIVRRVSGMPLNEFATKMVFSPLGMKDTLFNPSKTLKSRVAPTTMEKAGLVRGVVHDPTSRNMGGVTGHAGCFGTASDLAKYARMMLNQGRTPKGSVVLTPEIIQSSTKPQSPPSLSDLRGLGWDIDSSFSTVRGEIFPTGASYGHTGWTGTSIWIDPASRSFLILLANRNHPSEKGRMQDLRILVANEAALAMGLERPSPRRPVLNGIDGLEKTKFAKLAGLKLGLITNHTGRNIAGTPTIDLLAKAEGVQLKALFSPEHGIRGQLDQETISDTKDETTGLPIHSLYGKTRKPTAEQLRELDALVFDIQDIGCRFYTYIGTMLYAMEAASEQGKKFIVLDRVNPISGLAPDGPISEGAPALTACHPLPVRHGMTVGELAKMFVAEKKLKLELEVIPVEGWDRSQWLDQTGLTWVNPSPNMRSLTAATLYPGVGLLEMTNVSVGRGTATPFEVMGAPWINSKALIQELEKENLRGITFKSVDFTPTASVFSGKECHGVRFVVFDRNHFQPVNLGVALARALQKNHKGIFSCAKFNQLLFHPATTSAVENGKSLPDIRKLWQPPAGNFVQRREAFLMYR